jgi:hypothetical protein
MPANLTLTITHPSGTLARQVVAVDVAGPQRRFGQSATLDFTVAEDYWLLSDAGNAANPLRENCLVLLERDGNTLFRGYAYQLERTQTAAGEQAVKVSCKDRMGKWEKTLAGSGAHCLFTAECPTAEFGRTVAGDDGPFAPTPISLVPADQQAGYDSTDAQWPVYPKFSSATDEPSSHSPWLAKSVMRLTETLDSIDDSSTDPILVLDWTVFTAPGFAQLGDELVQYEAVYPASPASGNTGYLANLTRGALGSVAAGHLAGTECCQRCLKTLSPRVLTTLTHNSGDPLPSGDYRIKVTDGRFDFSYDPASLSFLFGYYGAYDEDSVDGLTLGKLATRLLKFDRELGGPGLSDDQIDISGLDFIPVSRFQVDSEQGTLETLQGLIDEVALDRRGFSEKPIGLYYDSDTDQAVLTSIVQSPPALAFHSAADVTDQAGLDSLYSAVAVRFASDDPCMLTSRDRMWHAAPGDQFNTLSSPNDTFVTDVMYCAQDRALAAGWQADPTDTHASSHLRYLSDGLAGTGWGLRFDSPIAAYDAEPPAVVLYAWFEDPAAVINSARLVLDMRGYAPGGELKLDLVAFDSYEPGTTDDAPPSIGSIVPLSDTLAFIIYGGSPELSTSARTRRWVALPGQPMREVL